MRGGLPGRLFKMISSHSFKSQMMAMQYWGAQHVKQVVLHQGQVELSSQFHRIWPPHFAQSLFPWSTGTAEAPPGARTIEASIIANIWNLVIEAPCQLAGKLTAAARISLTVRGSGATQYRCGKKRLRDEQAGRYAATRGYVPRAMSAHGTKRTIQLYPRLSAIGVTADKYERWL
jgi:hypothetical protein